MANGLYGLGREKFLNADIDWAVDTIKIQPVTSGYSANLTTHEFLTDITVGSNGVGTAQTLGTKTSTLGVADAADPTFTAVTGSAIAALVIYKDTGSAATSPLIAYIDTGTGLPVTPNGGDITVQFDSGANKIFKL